MLVIWLGTWLLSGQLGWLSAIIAYPVVVVILTLATGRTFVVSGGKLYRGKSCTRVVVNLDHVRRVAFHKSPSPLLRDDAISFLMDPKLSKGIDQYYLAVGNLRTASAAEFAGEIRERNTASQPNEKI